VASTWRVQLALRHDAAANAALDACAASERARGGVGSAVAWGAWRGGGMAAAAGAAAADRFGLGALSSAQGRSLLLQTRCQLR
jgi:KS-AT-KR-ACP domain-containing polyene macrolide polyketide synthase/pimaricinolide synthase PimS2/candicidin polyketide synthase FscD